MATFSSCKIEVIEESDCVFSRHTAHHVCLTGRQVPLPCQFLFMVRGEPDAYCVSDRSGCSLGDSGDFISGSFALPGLTLFVLLRQKCCSLGDSGDFIFGSFAMPGLTLFVLLRQKDECLTGLAVPPEVVETFNILFLCHASFSEFRSCVKVEVAVLGFPS